jgi:hypothetical protein
MSETPPPEPFPAAEELTEPVADPLPKHGTPAASSQQAAAAPVAEPPRPSKSSRWVPLAALLIAVIAVAGAALGWFFPHKSASSAPTYSDQQQKDAKKHICGTFKIVDRAVVKNSHLKNPDNGGPIGALSVATAQRFAFYGGGAYLRDRLNLEPATPTDLATPANALATDLEELSIGYLAGAQEFAQDELRQNLDDKIKAIVEVCKKDAPPTPPK